MEMIKLHSSLLRIILHQNTYLINCLYGTVKERRGAIKFLAKRMFFKKNYIKKNNNSFFFILAKVPAILGQLDPNRKRFKEQRKIP